MPKKLLGFDFGQSRIGIASGQTLTNTASPVGTVVAHLGAPDWAQIEAIIKRWHPSDLIVGLPLDVEDKYTEITIAAEKFGLELENRFNIPVHFIDEKYSTREARWRLEKVKNKSVNHYKVDAMAACVILETWMNRNGSTAVF